MTNESALLFIGNCLTLSSYPERMADIRATICSGSIDWERVVWISTSHLVFPALYLNFKRAGLLDVIPTDLVDYMEEFTEANRNRNGRIIKQCCEVANLLNKESIVPIFMKGTANLLSGLYLDIGERMMVDMDILLEKGEMYRAAEILKEHGYVMNGWLPRSRKFSHWHYPPLVKENGIVAVEIHHRMVDYPYKKYLNFHVVKNDCVKLPLSEDGFVMSENHQLIYNMMVMQMNDGGYLPGYISLGKSYDLLLLSMRVNALEVVSAFGHYFDRFNAFLAVSSTLLNHPSSLNYKNDWKVLIILKRLNFYLKYPNFLFRYELFFRRLRQIRGTIAQIFRMIYRKDVRETARRKWKRIFGKSNIM